MLEDIKILLDIRDNSQDSLINIYTRRAVSLIKNYLNNISFDESYIIANFQDAIIEIVILVYRNKGNENIKSKSQGSRSVTYSDGSTFAITESVKTLLPAPRIKMF